MDRRIVNNDPERLLRQIREQKRMEGLGRRGHAPADRSAGAGPSAQEREAAGRGGNVVADEDDDLAAAEGHAAASGFAYDEDEEIVADTPAPVLRANGLLSPDVATGMETLEPYFHGSCNLLTTRCETTFH